MEGVGAASTGVTSTSNTSNQYKILSDPSKKTHRIGSYIKWPKGIAGGLKVINIKTPKHCVEYSIRAHFMKKHKHPVYMKPKNKHGQWARTMKNEKTYQKRDVARLFSIPKGMEGPLTSADITKIEEDKAINIFIYQMTKDTPDPDDSVVVEKSRISSDYSLRLIREGGRPNTSVEDTVHLCMVNESNHVAYIPDIQDFIRVVNKNKGYYKSYKSKHPTSKFCIKCFDHFQDEKKHSIHWETCKHSKPDYMITCRLTYPRNKRVRECDELVDVDSTLDLNQPKLKKSKELLLTIKE